MKLDGRAKIARLPKVKFIGRSFVSKITEVNTVPIVRQSIFAKVCKIVRAERFELDGLLLA